MSLESFLRTTTLTTRKVSPKVINTTPLVKAKPKPKPKSTEPKIPRQHLMADFETTTDPTDCRVWAWGVVDIHNPKYRDVEVDNTIESFIEYISKVPSTCYFHNLKFDGVFILDWLMKNGFRHVTSEFLRRPFTFKTLINAMGAYYSITVKWESGHTTEFRDSLKKIPMPVKRIAEAFKLESSKGEIDYDAYRAPGHILTDEEDDYLRRDIIIVAQALKQTLENGMKRLTVASDALTEFKQLMGSEMFMKTFPILSDDMDAEIRRAYRGGWTYCDGRFSKQITGCGLVLDVNSLYPSVMMNQLIPYGTPQFQKGKVRLTKEYPLSVFSVTFTAKLKKDHLPCIQIKGNSMFGATEYLTNIPDPVTLMVTNVDWDLYNDQYDIDVIAYEGGWRFHAVKGMFNDYINKWGEIKANSVGGQREIAKLFMNALYGKFATNPDITGKYPILEDGRIKLVRGAKETRSPVYTPAGVFITSWARDLTIRAAQSNYDVFAYADTDSLHLLTDTIPESIEVHPTKMGAWKLEYHFDNAFYIRAKAYIENTPKPECGVKNDEHIHDDSCHWVTHIAGLPDRVTEFMTFDDMVDGKIFHGKLNPQTVPGGVVLRDIPFKLKL